MKGVLEWPGWLQQLWINVIITLLAHTGRSWERTHGRSLEGTVKTVCWGLKLPSLLTAGSPFRGGTSAGRQPVPASAPGLDSFLFPALISVRHRAAGGETWLWWRGRSRSCQVLRVRPGPLPCTSSAVATQELLQIVLNHMASRSYETGNQTKQLLGKIR